MLGAGTLGRPNRDDMGRVVGEGFRVGNSCTPVADSCQCMAKPIQYCKVKKKKNNSHQTKFTDTVTDNWLPDIGLGSERNGWSQKVQTSNYKIVKSRLCNV